MISVKLKEDMYSPLLWITVFLVFRAFLILWLNWFAGGKELASDVVFHDLIIKDPLAILKGTSIHIASYPPFQWVIEWPTFSLFALYFKKMISYRLMMVTIETIALIVFIYRVGRYIASKQLAVLATIISIFSPHQYFSTVFFVQEDIISQLFMVTAAAFILSNYRGWCIASLVLGVLIAKIYFLIPLYYIILFQGKYSLPRRALDGIFSLVPIVLVYYISITNALHNGGEVPIRDFTPDATYAGNYWVLFLKNNPESLEWVKNTSVIISAIVQLGLTLTILIYYRRQASTIPPIILLTVPLAFFFSTFYQHMPEYFLILWPVLALICKSATQQLIIAIVFSASWAPRIFHGLVRTSENFGTPAEARTEIIGPYLHLIPFNPELLNQAALALQSFSYSIFLLWISIVALKYVIANKTTGTNRQ